MVRDKKPRNDVGMATTKVKYDKIITSLRNDGFARSYLVCIECSDFRHESEMLLIAGFDNIEGSGFYSMIDTENYDKWIHSMQIFQRGFIVK